MIRDQAQERERAAMQDGAQVPAAVSLSEVISAMTFALDLTEGAVPGHGLRCCLLGMRLGDGVGLPAPMRASLYYALQLKDVGCSSNAARVCEMVGGDDRTMKAATKLTDWRRPLKTLRGLWPAILPGQGVARKVRRLFVIGMARQRNNQAMTELRCDRGAEIVRQLKIGEPAAEAVRRLDELWNGSGYPGQMSGQAIPLLARICAVAQYLDVFAQERGEDAALGVLQKRSGTWFDPELVQVALRLHGNGSLWKQCCPGDDVEVTRTAVLALDPGMRAELMPRRIDEICEAFARVVDAKSPFTYRHSVGVAEVAVDMAEEMGLGAERVRLVRRAALLHDVGKLIVSNTILDKAGALTEEEWAVVRAHPEMSRTILERVSVFAEVAAIAGEHHERLDGSGYPRGLVGEEISMESRVVAMADSFAALAEERPYRGAMAPRVILAMLEPQVPVRLDATCFAALRRVVERSDDVTPMGEWTVDDARRAGEKEWTMTEV